MKTLGQRRHNVLAHVILVGVHQNLYIINDHFVLGEHYSCNYFMTALRLHYDNVAQRRYNVLAHVIIHCVHINLYIINDHSYFINFTVVIAI